MLAAGAQAAAHTSSEGMCTGGAAVSDAQWDDRSAAETGWRVGVNRARGRNVRGGVRVRRRHRKVAALQRVPDGRPCQKEGRRRRIVAAVVPTWSDVYAGYGSLGYGLMTRVGRGLRVLRLRGPWSRRADQAGDLTRGSDHAVAGQRQHQQRRHSTEESAQRIRLYHKFAGL